MRLFYGTNFVLENEPCLGLAELSLPALEGSHRYQVITVIRDDKEVEFRQDLGLSEKFKVDQFIIPGGVREGKGGVIVHTVGELRNIADQLRDKKLWDKRELVQNNDIREKY